MSPSPRRARTMRALLCTVAVGATALSAGALAGPKQAPQAKGSAAKVPFALVKDRDVNDRLTQPEDRYAVASGCYTVQAAGHGYLKVSGGGAALSKNAADATPLHFRATKLGEYLLATNKGRDTTHPGATWDKRGFLAAASTAGLATSSALKEDTAPSTNACLLYTSPSPRDS